FSSLFLLCHPQSFPISSHSFFSYTTGVTPDLLSSPTRRSSDLSHSRARIAISVASISSPSTRRPATTWTPPPPPLRNAGGAYRPPAGRRLHQRPGRRPGPHLQPPGPLPRGRGDRRFRAAGRRGGGQAPVPGLRALRGCRHRRAGGAARARPPGPVRIVDLRR